MTTDNRDDGRREYTGPLPPSIDRLVRAAKVVLDQIPDIRPACFDGRELQELARAAAFWDQPTHRDDGRRLDNIINAIKSCDECDTDPAQFCLACVDKLRTRISDLELNDAQRADMMRTNCGATESEAGEVERAAKKLLSLIPVVPHDEPIVESVIRDTIAAATKRERERVREQAIIWGTGIPPLLYGKCLLCKREWREGTDERHRDGCAAAIRGENADSQ